MQLPTSITEYPTTQMPATHAIPQAVELASNQSLGPTHVDVAVATNETAHLRVDDVNLSSVEPPNPDNMFEPPRTPRAYNVFTAGDRVGIADARRPINTSAIPSLPFFSVRRFNDWDTALVYYTNVYKARQVLVHSEHHAAPVNAPLANPNGMTSLAPTAGPSSALPAGPVAAATAIISVPTLASGTNLPTALAVPGSVSAPTGAATAEASGNLASPSGQSTCPIYVSSAFPTPVLPRPKSQLLPTDTDKHPLAIDKLLPPSRLQRIMQAARLSPTGGRSKTTRYEQQTLSFPKASTQSSAATRVIRNKGKGKDTTDEPFDHLRYVRGMGPEPLAIVCDDSDDEDYLPGPSYPKALSGAAVPGPSHPKTRSATKVAQLELAQTASSTDTQSMPSITITTPSTIAPALVVTTTATAPAAFQTPPNNHMRQLTTYVYYVPPIK